MNEAVIVSTARTPIGIATAAKGIMAGEYALQSQQRTAAAQRDGLFGDEIVPLATTKRLFDKEGNVTGSEEVTLALDEGNRADTTLDSLAKLEPVWKGGQWVEEGRFICSGTGSASMAVRSRSTGRTGAVRRHRDSVG